jgi:tetratricopeptide (TPR) repeat protein
VLSRGYAIVNGIVLVLTIAGWFLLPRGESFEPKWYWLPILLALDVIVALIWDRAVLLKSYNAARRLVNELADDLAVTGKELARSCSLDVAAPLADTLRAADRQKKWGEVIQLGRALSRPLWLTGRYALRLEVGRLVEKAASFTGQPRAQAAALIDDLGWTQVARKEYDKAIESIQHGIQIAEKAGDAMLVCKGHRHLSGIALRQGNVAKARTLAAKVESQVPSITNKRDQDEMIASIENLYATITEAEGDTTATLSHLTRAEELFKALGDRERAIKVYARRGRIQLRLGDVSSAKDTFRQGVTAAREVSRSDCLYANLMGLADIAHAEENIKEEREYLLEAQVVAAELGKEIEVSEIVRRLKRLETN